MQRSPEVGEVPSEESGHAKEGRDGAQSAGWTTGCI